MEKLSTLVAGRLLFQNIGAVSGTLAVALGAYGFHEMEKRSGAEEYKRVFEVANRYHFFHSIVLLTMPLLTKPLVPGILLTAGMTLFSGSCYLAALKENRAYGALAPVGGILLIGGWASILFCI